MAGRDRLLRLALLPTDVGFPQWEKAKARARSEVVAALVEDPRFGDAEAGSPATVAALGRTYTSFCSYWIEAFPALEADVARTPSEAGNDSREAIRGQ